MLPGTVDEISFYQVTNRLAGLTQDALAARLETVREVVMRSLGEIDTGGANQVNRGFIQGIDHEPTLEWA
jgi:hypothetical protein